MQHLTSKVSWKLPSISTNFYQVKSHNFENLYIVIAYNIQRASGKLQKWDQMATKITEMGEQRRQEAREKEIKIQKKIDGASKLKAEYFSYQKEVSKDRLTKWQNRKEKHGKTLNVEDRKRLNV